MFHFRFTAVLKDLLNNTLRCPLAASVRRCCVCVAPAGASSRRRVLHAASHPPLLRAASSAGPSRRFCVKTEDSVCVDEQLKKDGVNRAEEAGDK